MDIVKKDESAIKKAIKKFSLQRVAIYCRVSKGNKEESSSIKWQINLKEIIEEHRNWILVGIYADVKSGLNIKKRKSFQRLIKDGLEGMIDIVLTKSMSRFSRNTVEILNTVRLLKEKGVEVMFDIDLKLRQF